MPKAISTADIEVLLQFEQQFEKVGMPALGVISLKLLLLLLTVSVALHARFYRIPKLSVHTLKAFSTNIILVTLFSVSSVVVGTLFRTGLS